jgi:hypothetical protein
MTVVTARKHLKRMRGGANAQLLLCDDDQYYVVKFRNNPQHARILVNELVCSLLLKHLRIPTPECALVNVPESLIRDVPALIVGSEGKTSPCEAGLNFGSRVPVDPERRAIYEYLPVEMLRMLLNRSSFLGVAAFDKWVSNADTRQVIFFRDWADRWRSPESKQGERWLPPRSMVYVANMIDHGFAFNAHRWSFTDSPELGLYPCRGVYESVSGYDSFQPWLDAIVNCTAETFDMVCSQVPPEWFDCDWGALEDLLECLYRRRKLVPDLLWAAKHDTCDPFPQWTSRPTSHRATLPL